MLREPVNLNTRRKMFDKLSLTLEAQNQIFLNK